MTKGRAEIDANVFGPVRDSLTAWRERRKPRDHIPEEIWRPAVRLAIQHGISRTSKAL